MRFGTTCLTLLLVAATMSGCEFFEPQNTGPSKYQPLASGKVVSVGIHNLVLEDKGSVMFVSLSEQDKIVRSSLKKGDQVTLLGIKATNTKESDEIDEIQLANGHRVPLGQ